MRYVQFLSALLGASLAIVLVISTPSSAQRDEVQTVRVTWVGGATMVMRFGPISIATDPVFGEGKRAFQMFDPNTGDADGMHDRLAPLPVVSFEDLDLVLVSHDHEDHLDSSALDRLSDYLFLIPVAQSESLRARGLTRVEGLAWDEVREISKSGYKVRIRALPARHSANPETSALLGQVNGYWLEFTHGSYKRSIYWTGDTFPQSDDMKNGFGAPDLLVVHLGGVGADGPFGKVSMGAAEAVDFADRLQPTSVLPIHHSTFSHYREPIENFHEMSSGRIWLPLILREGEELALD